MSAQDKLAAANDERQKVLATSKVKRFQELLSVELAPRLAEHGFLPSPAPRAMTGLWFASKDRSQPHVSAAVQFLIEPRRDWLGLAAFAHLISEQVADVVRTMPEQARAKSSSNDSPYLGSIELVGFDNFVKPAPAGEFPMVTPPSVPRAADWIQQCLSGPVAEWFTERDSLKKLVELAKLPATGAADRNSPSARRLRATVTLCGLEGRLADAAGLMSWYLREGRFDGLDSPERASAFDDALAQQFPGYSQARLLLG